MAVPRRPLPTPTPAAVLLPGLLAMLVASCGDGERGPAPQDPKRPAAGERIQPPAEFFDFGSIDHGKAKEHDFVLDPIAVFGPGYYAAGTHVDCSCARTQLLLRGDDGTERLLQYYNAQSAPQPGEKLVVRTLVDTVHKEPVDHEPVDSRVLVVFQRTDARDSSSRVMWPLNFRFSIDSPVRVRPYAVLDFERVPECRSAELLSTLSGDPPEQAVRFGPVRCEDDRFDVTLEPRGDVTVLRTKFTPRSGDLGAFRALVTVDTDLESGYRVNLAAVGTVVPVLEATPTAKLSIRTDLRQEQPVERAQSQYLLVTDHDPARTGDLVVHALTGDDGADARGLFDVTFETIDGAPRTRLVRLRWVGRSDTEFRGSLVLATDPNEGPFLPIEVVALHLPPR